MPHFPNGLKSILLTWPCYESPESATRTQITTHAVGMQSQCSHVPSYTHTQTHNDSVMRHFSKQNHRGSLLTYSNLLFTSHPRKTYWAFPFPYSSSTHTRQHRKRGIASVNHVLSTPRVTVYTNNVRPPTHTDPAMGESRRKTQEDTLSMADMEREQSLICNH